MGNKIADPRAVRLDNLRASCQEIRYSKAKALLTLVEYLESERVSGVVDDVLYENALGGLESLVKAMEF